MKKEIRIPEYKLSEELINSISHGIGAIFAVVVLVMTVVCADRHRNVAGVVSASLYGSTMILMYLMSCLYHSLSPKRKAKKVFRVIDHCDIYLFIAGSYSPYCISLIGGTTGWSLFVLIWIFAILGVILNAIDLERFEKISMFMYILMGWMIIFSLKSLLKVLPLPGLYLLAGGGIVYTLGAILYRIGAKKPYFHSVFHFFVLGGSVLQFFSILLYTL